MNNFFKLTAGLMIVAGILSPLANAKPESFAIRSEDAKSRHRRARNAAQNLDLSKIQDPQARLALQTVFDALKLDTKKSS